MSLGGATPGDKTMLDAILPFADSLSSSVDAGDEWQSAWGDTVPVAQKAADDTASMRPTIGRARPLAERSVGTPDARAISMAMCARTVAELFSSARES